MPLANMDDRYLEKRKAIEEVFSRYSKLDKDSQSTISPSGLYQLGSHDMANSVKSAGNTQGELSEGLQTTVLSQTLSGTMVISWHSWIDHPNGSEYLLCGEDYQGYSILNFTTGQYRVYFPEEGYPGVAFCWAAVHPSPDRLVLAVDGCIWACPYELRFFDFRRPDRLPYTQIGNVPDLAECRGWVDNETFVLEREVAVRK